VAPGSGLLQVEGQNGKPEWFSPLEVFCSPDLGTGRAVYCPTDDKRRIVRRTLTRADARIVMHAGSECNKKPRCATGVVKRWGIRGKSGENSGKAREVLTWRVSLDSREVHCNFRELRAPGKTDGASVLDLLGQVVGFAGLRDQRALGLDPVGVFFLREENLFE
jgi:hypothetical protein